MHLEVLECGAGTSLQDEGRYGFQRFGVGTSGAMDFFALGIANHLVGNALGHGAIEFMGLGGRFKWLQGEVSIALSGGASLHINGKPIAAHTSQTLKMGDEIVVNPASQGVYSYLAFKGGFQDKGDLGSQSYHLRAGLGKKIEKGQVLALNAGVSESLQLPAFQSEQGAFHVVLGPQADYFSANNIETFLNNFYTISREADRMGFRLEGGEPVEHALGFNIISDGIVRGSIQIPGSQQPIVLLADRQTTGGYPKIATLISSDIPRFAQMRVGEKVQFKAVSQEEAIKTAKLKHFQFLEYLSLAKSPMRELTSEFLLSQNLNEAWAG